MDKTGEREEIGKAAMERNRVEKAKKWQEDRANAAYATRVDNLALAGLQIVGAQAGRILCNFLVPKHLAVSTQ